MVISNNPQVLDWLNNVWESDLMKINYNHVDLLNSDKNVYLIEVELVLVSSFLSYDEFSDIWENELKSSSFMYAGEFTKDPRINEHDYMVFHFAFYSDTTTYQLIKDKLINLKPVILRIFNFKPVTGYRVNFLYNNRWVGEFYTNRKQLLLSVEEIMRDENAIIEIPKMNEIFKQHSDRYEHYKSGSKIHSNIQTSSVYWKQPEHIAKPGVTYK